MNEPLEREHVYLLALYAIDITFTTLCSRQFKVTHLQTFYSLAYVDGGYNFRTREQLLNGVDAVLASVNADSHNTAHSILDVPT